MENLTNLTNNLTILSPYENVMDCNDLTSNGLYMIFNTAFNQYLYK